MARIGLMLVVLMLLVGCGDAGPAPRSQAEFIAAYQKAFEAGDKKTIMGMVKTDGMPDDLRKSVEAMLTMQAGKHRITKIEMTDFAPDPDLPDEINGRRLEPTLPPQHWLIVEHEGNEGFEGGKSSGKMKFGVGVEDGVYRFCGMRWGN